MEKQIREGKSHPTFCTVCVTMAGFTIVVFWCHSPWCLKTHSQPWLSLFWVWKIQTQGTRFVRHPTRSFPTPFPGITNLVSPPSPSFIVSKATTSMKSQQRPSSDALQAKPTAQVCDLGRCMGPQAKKGPMVGWMLWCHHLKILNKFIFELVFIKEVRWSITPHVRAEDIHVTCVPAIPCCPILIRQPWYRNAGGSIFRWQAVSLTDPLPHFPFEPELALNAKSSILRSMNDQRTLPWTFQLMSLSYTEHPLTWKWWPRRKEKKNNLEFLSFPSLPYSSASWRERFFIECVHLKTWNKRVESVLCNISTVLARTKYICT